MHHVGRSTSFQSFIVQVTSLSDEKADICNMNSNFVDGVTDLINGEGIIDVSGCNRVNAKDSPGPQVQSLLYFVGWDVPLLSFRVYIFNKDLQAFMNWFFTIHVVGFSANIVLSKYANRLSFKVASLSDVIKDSAFCSFVGCLPFVKICNVVPV